MDNENSVSLYDFRTNGNLPVAMPPSEEASVSLAPPTVVLDRFQLLADGVYMLKDSKDGDGELEWLCSPLTVTALFRGPDGKNWGRLVEVVDLDCKVHCLQVENAVLASKPGSVRSRLGNAGLRTAPGSKASSAVIEYLHQSAPSRRVTRVDRNGWVDKACKTFVLVSGRIIGDGDVIRSSEIRSEANQDPEVGTLGDWQSNVAGACIGNDLLLLGVSLAFSGPLLEILGLEGGGLHLRGASSSGKSTILQVAESVWGPPGNMHSWRATANGLEGIAAACNGGLLVLDELAEVSSADASDAAYMLANGKGKSRATSIGETRPPLQWKVSILSSGEISLADKMAEGGRKAMAGQEVRLIDICADDSTFGAFHELHGTTSPADFADRLKNATLHAYGSAGPAFLERLIGSGELQSIPKFISRFRNIVRAKHPPADGVDDRIVHRFALIAAAGEIATQFGITGWKRGMAMNAAYRVLLRTLRDRLGADPDSVAALASIERTRNFLRKHAGDFADVPAPGTAQGGSDPIGWLDKSCFMFTKETWHALHAGFDPVVAARHLKAAGFLLPGEGSNLARHGPSAVAGRPRLYFVRATLLDKLDN